MPGLALTVTPAVLTLLFGGQPTHTTLAPAAAVYVEMGQVELAPRTAFEAPLRIRMRATAPTITPERSSPTTSSSPTTLSRRFIVIGNAAAGLAGGGLMFLLPGDGPRVTRENPRITLRLGRYRTATALFGASF